LRTAERKNREQKEKGNDKPNVEGNYKINTKTEMEGTKQEIIKQRINRN